MRAKLLGFKVLRVTDNELFALQDALDDSLCECDLDFIRAELRSRLRLARRIHQLTGDELPPKLIEASK
jgi:hypothetical protein